jgi:ferric-dicitrate binding protein FerR (iron transport regulator)
MRAVRLSPLILCALLAACSDDPGPTSVADAGAPKPQALARLTLAQGKVELLRDGKPARAADIEDLFDQDLIITGEGARAIIKFKGGGEVELAQSSRFRITRSAANVDVDLQTGIISLIEGDGVSVVTPWGRTRLKPGDVRVRLGKEQDGLTLDLLVGEITQLDEDGGAVQVKPGQKLKFQVGAISVIEEGEDPNAAVTRLPVMWLPVAGAAELKPKGEKRFKPAKAKVELAEGTMFKLANNARARLEAPGLNAQLGGGSNGTVESAGQQGKKRQLQVSLGSGLLDLQFVGDGQTELVIPAGGAVAKVRGSGRAQVRLVATAKGVRIVVMTGEVEVASGDGAAQRVKAGEAALVDKAKVEVSAVKKPHLLLPMGKRVRVYGLGSQEVALDLPDEPVEVEVASDADFKELLLTGKAQGFVTLVDPPSVIHWRARAAAGAEPKTGKATFLKDRKETKGTSSSDIVPEKSGQIVFLYQGELPAITFTWDPTEGATGYHLLVYSGGKALVDRKVDETKATVAAGIIKDGEYSWHALPMKGSATGKGKLGAEMANLKVAFDNSFTGLAITGPQPGEKASGSTRARGVAPLGTKLYINGAPVSLDDKGRYDVSVGKSSPLIYRLVSGDGEDFYVRTTR